MLVYADSLCNEARALVPTIEASRQRAIALSNIAVAFAQADQEDRATQLAREIEEEYRRADALRKIGKVLAQAGRYDRAIAIVQTITDLDYRSRALQDLAPILAIANDYHATAIDIAQAIKEPDQRAVILRRIVESFAQAGDFAQARTYVQTIDEPNERAHALAEIAKALAYTGNADLPDEALPLCREASIVARKIDEIDQQTDVSTQITRSEVLQYIAETLALAGDYEQAPVLAREIKETHQRAAALITISEVLARRKERQSQLRLIQQHWSHATSREYLLLLLAMANQMIISRYDQGFALEKEFSWVSQFLRRY